MKAVDDYLYTLKEDSGDEVVRWLEYYDLRQATLCKRILETESHMFLYHATRPQYVPLIEREGLTLSTFIARAKEEGDIPIVGKQPMLYMTNVRTVKPGFEFRWARNVKTADNKFGLIHIICKVKTDPSVLKWSPACCYYYLEDIPSSDLTWEGTREFQIIEKTDHCLVQKEVNEI